MKKIFVFILFALLLQSCKESNKANVKAEVIDQKELNNIWRYEVKAKETSGKCGAENVKLEIKTTFSDSNIPAHVQTYTISHIFADEEVTRTFYATEIDTKNKTPEDSSIRTVEFDDTNCSD